MFRTIGVFAMVALAFAGFAFAAAQGDSYKVSASLKARSEVPRPKRRTRRGDRKLHGHGSRARERQGEGHVEAHVLAPLRVGDCGAHPHRQARKGRPGGARPLRSVPERSEGHGIADARTVREARVRRGVREHPHGEERRRRDSRSDQGLGRARGRTGLAPGLRVRGGARPAPPRPTTRTARSPEVAPHRTSVRLGRMTRL